MYDKTNACLQKTCVLQWPKGVHIKFLLQVCCEGTRESIYSVQERCSFQSTSPAQVLPAAQTLPPPTAIALRWGLLHVCMLGDLLKAHSIGTWSMHDYISAGTGATLTPKDVERALWSEAAQHMKPKKAAGSTKRKR